MLTRLRLCRQHDQYGAEESKEEDAEQVLNNMALLYKRAKQSTTARATYVVYDAWAKVQIAPAEVILATMRQHVPGWVNSI